MRYFIVLGSPNTLPTDRLGVVASRRLGTAVVRNRAKRRLRDVFRRRRVAEDRRQVDVVVIPKREMVEAPMRMLEQDFDKALERLRHGGRA